MKLMSYGDFVSWEHCIEANKVCNLQNCPDTMNCCSTNCVGIPTLEGFILIGSISIIVLFFIWIFYTIKSAEKYIKENCKNE